MLTVSMVGFNGMIRIMRKSELSDGWATPLEELRLE
jgi:hypothetical protein